MYSKSKPSSIKPFCKVCFDAGKPETEYTTHYVRSADKTGKIVVVCPTLLTTECRYCHKQGHITKFCPTIASVNKNKEKIIKKEEYNTKTNKKEKEEPIQKNNKKSIFQCLNEDTEIKVDEFPALFGLKNKKTNHQTISGWATVTAKIVCEPEKIAFERIIREQNPVINKKVIIVKKIKRTNWVDMNDSEDDEEDNYEDYEQEDQGYIY